MMFAGALRRVSKTVLLLSLVLGVCVSGAWGQAATLGQWSTASYQMQINPVHVALMNNGKILVVAGSGNCPPSYSGCPTGAPYGASNHSGAGVLDPVAKTWTPITIAWDMFCSNMTFLADGRVFLAGGTIQYDNPFLGSQKATIFDPSTNTFGDVQSMAQGRWYPTATLLSDGRVMVFGGYNDTTGSTNSNVEIYTVGSGWSIQYPANYTPPLYPRMHLLPSGQVFFSGSSATSHFFNPTNQSWTTGPTTPSGLNRTYGASVLLPLTPTNGYDPKVILIGGVIPTATNTSEIIDLGQTSPAWVAAPSMSQSRTEMDGVLLPNGKVLAIAGSSKDEDATTAALGAEVYDPANTKATVFGSAGANSYARLYHTVSLLLPDATVWLAGGNPSRGNYEARVEIYQPPYLFNSDGSLATRPTITGAPTGINWGGQFTVTTDSTTISSVLLMRPGSSTHAFDMDQRQVGLNFTASAGTLTVTGPPNANIAPPGYYMLFLMNSQGVPSVAKFVLLNGTSNPPPNPTAVTPGSGTTAGGTAVTISGTNFSAGATVKFGGTSATNVHVVSSTSITATTPAHAAGMVNVVVTNSDSQIGTLSNGYSYPTSTGGAGISFIQSNWAPSTLQPSLTSLSVPFSANQTAGDLNVVIVGWGDTTSSVTTVTDTRGNNYSPAGGTATGSGLRQAIFYAKSIAAGANTVTVTFNQGAVYPDIRILEYSGLDASNPFDVTAAASGTGTTATSASATTTSANELIVGAGNTGKGFSGAGSGFALRMVDYYGNLGEDQAVTTIGSYNASAPLQQSTNWLMQMATFRASGQGSSNPAPTVTGISPTSGTTAGGTPVTITGTGFLAGATVTFGGTAATGVTVVSSTSITATTPAHAAGAVNVVVTNTDAQSGPLTNGYTYKNPAPTVTGISPTSGTTAGGTPVTITGTGFLAGATVTFGGTAATGVTVVSSTSITATTPAHAVGAVNVVVTNTDAQSGPLTNGYTYTTPTNPAPTVSGISPTSGTTAGGTPVTITGTGFLAGATVTFGGTAATGVTVVSSTSITASTPAHAVGAVNVVVTNTDGQSGPLTNGYTYTTSSGGGGIAFVQSGSGPNTLQATNTTLSVSYPAAQTAGDLNVVIVGWGDVTSLVSNVTDSHGNIYAQAGGTATGSGLRQAIYYAKSIAAGTNTVTVTFNQAAAYPDMRILEYSGLDASNPLDVTAAAVGTGTTATSASATTTAANELIVGAGNNGDGFSGAGTGFALRMIDYYGNLGEDQVVTTIGSYNASAPLKKSTVWVMQMATFKAAP